MDKKKKQTAILGFCLLIVFIAVLMSALGSGPSRAKAASNKTESAALQTRPASKTNTLENWAIPKPYQASSRDPMNTTVGTSAAKTQTESTLVISGIVHSSKKSSAIIANQVVFEGETIEGIKVIKIDKNSVEFEKDGKRWQQQLKE